MVIRLDRLGEEPFTWRQSYEPAAEAMDRAELVALSAVDCAGTVRSVSPGFLFQANASYAQTLSCMRCLRPSEVPMEIRVELLLMVHGDDETGEDETTERELESDDLGIVYLPGPAFDPETLIMEQLQLHIQMKPLCRADCAGLCTTCGADRNDGACTCQPAADPRWSALADLKKQLDS